MLPKLFDEFQFELDEDMLSYEKDYLYVRREDRTMTIVRSMDLVMWVKVYGRFGGQRLQMGHNERVRPEKELSFLFPSMKSFSTFLCPNTDNPHNHMVS